jgi:hypothetical protein
MAVPPSAPAGLQTTASLEVNAPALLLTFALASAPLSLWAVAIVGEQGLTISHLVGGMAIILAIRQARPLPRTVLLPLCLLVGVLVWGVCVLYIGGTEPALFERGARHALLFTFSVALFTASSTYRLALGGLSRHLRLLGFSYCVVVA